MSTSGSGAQFQLDELFVQGEDGLAYLERHASELTQDHVAELRAIGGWEQDEGRPLAAATVFLYGRAVAAFLGARVAEVEFAALLAAALNEADHKDVELALDDARRLGDEALAAGERAALPWFLMTVTVLANRLNRTERSEAARSILAHARRRCRAAGSRRAELWIVDALLVTCLQLDDLRPALHYAELLARNLDAAEAEAEDELQITTLTRGEVAELLTDVGNRFYYGRDDYGTAAAVAREAVRLRPETADAYVLLGHSLLQIGSAESLGEAAEALAAAISRPPVRPGIYLSYASALLALERPEEALESVDEALRRAPEEPRYHLTRGHILRALERPEDAVAAFTRAIELGRAEPLPDEPAPPPTSRAAYLRTAPGGDVADIAQVARVAVLVALGRKEEALADAADLAASSDVVARSAGYGFMAAIHQEAGRLDEALAAYSATIELDPTDAPARLARADLSLERGDVETALADLGMAARQGGSPDEALERLDRLVEERPEDPARRRCRGIAAFDALRLTKAVEDLSIVLEARPDDAEALYVRGLARIMVSTHEGERRLDGLTVEDVLRAVQDLGEAAHLELAGVATRAYRWLTDRISGDPGVAQWLIDNGNEPWGLFSIFPAVQEPVQKHEHANWISGRERRWGEAVAELKEARAGFEAAGFEVWAARISLRLVDNLLRLYELQEAFDELEKAQRIVAVHARPLTASLVDQAEEFAENAWLTSGTQAATWELEFMDVYPIGFGFVLTMLRVFEAQALSRVGEYERALEALGDLDELMDPEAMGIDREYAFGLLVNVVMTLRDAGDLDHALAFREVLVGLADNPRRRAEIENLMGSILAVQGDVASALDRFRAAQAAVEDAGLDAPVVQLNIASSLTTLGADGADAVLGVLDKLNRDELTDNETFALEQLRAQALRDAGRYPAAKKAVLTALEFAESRRGDLRLLELRMSQHARHEPIYELAVDIALRARDSRLAFELAERSRSRTLVDQLAAGPLPLPDDAERLIEVERNLSRRREALVALQESIGQLGSTYVDYELLRDLEDTGGLGSLGAGDGEEVSELRPEEVEKELTSVTASLQRIERAIEERRQAQAAVAAGRTIGIEELRALLRGR